MVELERQKITATNRIGNFTEPNFYEKLSIQTWKFYIKDFLNYQNLVSLEKVY